MATEGSVYQRGKDGRWVAQYRDASGKVQYLYRRSRQEAKQTLREALTDRDKGIVPPSKMTVGTLLDEWLEDISGDVSRRTWANQESIVRIGILSNAVHSLFFIFLQSKALERMPRIEVNDFPLNAIVLLLDPMVSLACWVVSLACWVVNLYPMT
jgi:hypothetical protein